MKFWMLWKHFLMLLRLGRYTELRNFELWYVLMLYVPHIIIGIDNILIGIDKNFCVNEINSIILL